MSALFVLLGAGARSAQAATPTVSLQAEFVGFYPGHLVLDGIGSAFLDDGVLHVSADRIIFDMRTGRYVAAGNVIITAANVNAGATDVSSERHGDALGVDLATHRGVLVDSASIPSSVQVDGAKIGGPAGIEPGDEPLALPDVGSERPFVRARRAVAHLGSDVRLAGARVIVPSGESVALPSYVYTYSSNPGYTASNIFTNGEDLPIYFGSTANSVQGAHFSYDPVTKVAFGLDTHIVGERSYALLSGSPLFGPTKVFNFTLQDNINDHTSQTFTSSTTTGFGTANNYDLRDSIHQSTLEIGGFAQPDLNRAAFAWQGFNQYFGWGSNRPYYNLRSEYGYEHVAQQFSFPPFAFDAVLPDTTWHKSLGGYLGSPTWYVSRNINIYGSVDLRGETDTLPHRQVSQIYALNLYTSWTPTISTYFTDTVSPSFDAYPSVSTIFHNRTNMQSLTAHYDNGDPFSLTLVATHETAVTDNPLGVVVAPWQLSGLVRLRVTPSLSLQLSRSYLFGFEGQRFGALGLQIFP